MPNLITSRLRLRDCPRCGGDIALDRDHWGWYEVCVQCGYMHDLQSIIELDKQRSQVRSEREKLSNLV